MIKVKLSERIIQELELLGNSKGHKYFYRVKQIEGITHVLRIPRSFDPSSKWEYVGIL